MWRDWTTTSRPYCWDSTTCRTEQEEERGEAETEVEGTTGEVPTGCLNRGGVTAAGNNNNNNNRMSQTLRIDAEQEEE